MSMMYLQVHHRVTSSQQPCWRGLLVCAPLEQRVGEQLQMLGVLGGSQWDLCWDGGNSDDPNVPAEAPQSGKILSDR